MRRWLQVRVTTEGGAAVRVRPDTSSGEVRRVAFGETVVVCEKLFSPDHERWFRLADNSGYIWWASASNSASGLTLIDFVSTAS